jgi:hydrogenase nickel incorporation protein HypA/HybF
MHEIATVQNILDIVLEQAKAARAKRVTHISLALGELSHITDQSISECFAALSENTIASQATLNFRRIPTRLSCKACGNTYSVSKPPWDCPHCHQPASSIVSGDECYVESIIIE